MESASRSAREHTVLDRALRRRSITEPARRGNEGLFSGLGGGRRGDGRRPRERAPRSRARAGFRRATRVAGESGSPAPVGPG